MKNKRSALIFLSLFSLLIIYSIRNNSPKTLTPSFNFPYSSITEIEIIRGLEHFKIEKQNQEWRILAKGKNHPADKEKLNSFLRELENIKIDSIISENPEKFKLFHVDESGISLQLKTDKETLNFIFGKRSADFSNQYARILQIDQTKVYILKHRLDEYIFSPPHFWRSKQILHPNLSATDFVDETELSQLDTGLKNSKTKLFIPLPNQDQAAELILGNKTKNDLYYLQIFGIKDWDGEVVLINESNFEKLKQQLKK